MKRFDRRAWLNSLIVSLGGSGISRLLDAQAAPPSGATMMGDVPGPHVTYPQTAAERTASISPTTPIHPEGDLRRYGATATASSASSGIQAANAAALNAALLVSAAGGSAAYIPPGRWYYNATVFTGNSSYGHSSMYGHGVSSVLIPASGIDGLTFVSDGPSQSSRFFRDFMIQGPSAATSSNSGILIPNTTTAFIVGVLFSNLSIQNFEYGFNLQAAHYGLWGSSFLNCYLFNNYHGYLFNGQSVTNSIIGGYVQAHTMTRAGSPMSYAINCTYSAPGNTQGFIVNGVNTYGYDVGISLNLTVYATIDNCAFSLCKAYGIYLGSIQGGHFIRGCWIQARLGSSSPDFAGIYLVNIGVPIADKIVIDANTILGNFSAGTIGVHVGSSQNGVTITNNTIGNNFFPLASGITGAHSGAVYNGINSQNLICTGNTIYATGDAIVMYAGALNATVGPNAILSGTPLAFVGGAPRGLVYKHPPAPMSGNATFTGGDSAAVTFKVPMPSSTYHVLLGGNAAGYTWVAAKTTTGFVINCSAPNSNSTDWRISYS
jgi:hypothetical protein